MIQLAIDFSSADSYLALDPTSKIADEIGVELHLIPYRVELTRIDSVDENTPIATKHQYVRNLYREKNVARYAKVQDLPPLRSDPYEDTSLALNGLMLANESGFAVGSKFAELVFQRYWHENLHIENPQVIITCLNEVGVDASSVDMKEVDHRVLREEYREKGVMGVPMYLVKGEVFQGRQHLPWIRELLLS